MPMLRRLGGTNWPRPLTTASSMRISPEVGFSKPAIMRSIVVLPQPEGPSSVTNSRSQKTLLNFRIT